MTDIPIQNIYYLLCYAWNKLDEGKIVDVNKIDSTELVDLFAKVLINGTAHLLKRGIDRSYIEYSDSLNTIRGKLNISNSIKRNLLHSGKAFCTFDEMDHDILHNQIIKTTIYRLLLIDKLNSDLRNELINLYRYFFQISTIDLNHKIFKSVRITRNNYFYLFLLNICELIYENLLPDENTGETKFRDFIQEEKKMAYLFEEFVRNFYKLEQSEYKVYREDIFWDFQSKSAESLKMLPKMQTDISLKSANKKIIIDTKFYKDAFSDYYDVEKFIQANLMQLYSYLTQVEGKGELNRNAEGILIYPTNKKSFSHEYNFGNHKLKLCTINLNQDWKEIHNSLIHLLQI